MGGNVLQSLLQGASNSAASTVSAPVDGISWLMRHAGMGGLIGNAPVGGSDWMAQQGLTAQPQNAIAGNIGEALGGVAPMLAAARAPQIASGLLQMGENAATPTSAANLQRGAIDVYHGTPHSFDSFDMSKIGTGEGAQAYGHGLYFAENPSTAASYAADRSYVGRTMAGVPDNTAFDAPWIAKQAMDVHGDGAAAHLQMVLRNNASTNPAQVAANKEVSDALALVQSGQVKPAGNTYETRLAWPDAAQEAADPLGPQHFLDWDKPLSQQPQGISDLVNGLGIHDAANGEDLLWKLKRQQYGVQDAMLGNTGGPAGAYASGVLQQAGIPGIRYLDQGSRGAGQGSANYVIFDDKIPTITGRR